MGDPMDLFQSSSHGNPFVLGLVALKALRVE